MNKLEVQTDINGFRNTVMAVGTPKRSAQEVIHSARKYVKVVNPLAGYEQNIAMNTIKVSKSTMRGTNSK